MDHLGPRERTSRERDNNNKICHSNSVLEYAQVLKMLGNGRLEAQCFDGTKRLAHIRVRFPPPSSPPQNTPPRPPFLFFSPFLFLLGDCVSDLPPGQAPKEGLDKCR